MNAVVAPIEGTKIPRYFIPIPSKEARVNSFIINIRSRKNWYRTKRHILIS